MESMRSRQRQVGEKSQPLWLAENGGDDPAVRPAKIDGTKGLELDYQV